MPFTVHEDDLDSFEKANEKLLKNNFENQKTLLLKNNNKINETTVHFYRYKYFVITYR